MPEQSWEFDLDCLEEVPAGGSLTLVRVSGRWSDIGPPDGPVWLVVRSGGSRLRVRPLPETVGGGTDTVWGAAFGVPAERIPGASYALRTSEGLLELDPQRLAKAQALADRLEVERASMWRRAETAQEEKDAAAARAAAAEYELEAAHGAIDRLEAERDQLSTSFAELRDQHDDVRAQLEKATEERDAGLQRGQALSVELEAARGAIDRLEAERVELSTSFAELRDQHDDVRAQLEKAAEERDAGLQRGQALSVELEAARGSIRAITTSRDEARAHAAELEEELRQSLLEAQESLEAAERRIQALDSALEVQREAREQAATEAAELSHTLEERATERDEVAHEREELRSRITVLTGERDALRTAHDEAVAERDRLAESAAELDRLTAHHATVVDRFEAVSREHQELLSEREASRGGVERTERQLSELRRIRAELTRELYTARDRAEEAERTATEHEAAERELQEKLENYTAFSDAERATHEQTLEQARARVAFLESRLVQATHAPQGRVRATDDDAAAERDQ